MKCLILYNKNLLFFSLITVQDVNVAAVSLGATVAIATTTLQNSLKAVPAIRDSQQDLSHRYEYIDSKDYGDGIFITLGRKYIINMISIQWMDTENESYSYYVQISTDNIKWTEIINYRDYNCRSWQYLYFSPTVVR